VRRLRAVHALITACSVAAACASDAPSGTPATIVLDSLVTFGVGPDGESVLVDFPIVTRDGRGRYYAVDLDRAHLHRFTADGHWDARFGGPGDGPSEFRRIAYLQGRPDGGVDMYDQMPRRVTMLDADGTQRGLFQLDFAAMTDFPARRSDGRYIANAMRMDPNGAFGSSIGPLDPMHLLDSSFAVVQSFGSSPADSGLTIARFRQFALGADDHVWTLREERYEIERFDASGHRVARFTPTDLPFPSRPETVPVNEWPGPPNPFAIWVDTGGRVWTGFLDATAAWQAPGMVVDGRTGLPALRSQQDMNVAFETILDVRDPATGALIARGRFPLALRGVVDADHLFQLHEDADGGILVTIWRARVTGGSDGTSGDQAR
jgi:hypothetical protein